MLDCFSLAVKNFEERGHPHLSVVKYPAALAIWRMTSSMDDSGGQKG